MTMTELIGTLERQGWRFQAREGQVSVRLPSPAPADADELLEILARRRSEAAGFLRVRAVAERLRELFRLPEIPVFHQTPVPAARILTFPVELQAKRPAATHRRGRA